MATRDEEQSSKRLSDNLKQAEKSLNKIRSNAGQAANDFKDINTFVKEIAKNNKDLEASSSRVTKANERLSNLANEITKFTSEQLKDRKATEKFLEDEKKVVKELSLIETERLEIRRQKIGLLGKEDKESKKQLAFLNKYEEQLNASAERAERIRDGFKEIAEANKELNKETAFFDKLASVAKDIPIIGKGLGEFAEASQKIRDSFGSSKFTAGLTALFQLGSKAAMGAAVSGLVKADTQITSLARTLSTSRANAAAFRGEMIDAAMKSGTPVKYLMEAVDSVNESLGTTGIITTDQAKQFYTLTHRMGLSQQAANGLFEVAAATGKEFENFNSEIFGTVKALNAVEGTAVDVKAVMDDIGNMSAATTLTTSKFSGGLAKAAFTARKFGLEMSQLESAAGNLLDFESSISAELEAELLTGRQLNLENARMAALRGDMVSLAEELNKQNITAESFGKMNVLQQEAIAKSMGMSRDEMAKMFVRQEGMAKVAEQLNNAKFMELSNEEQMAEIMKLSGEERIKALQSIGEEEMAQQYANITAADKMANAADVMTNSFKADTLNKTITQPLTSAINNFGLGGAAMMIKAMAAAGLLYYSGIGGKLAKFGGRLGRGFLGGGMKGVGKVLNRGILKPITSVGGSILKGVTGAPGAVRGALSTAGLAKMVGYTGPVASTVAKTAKNVGGKNIAKTLTKTGGKSLGKSLLKKIPVVGAIAGIGLGLSRAMKGDFTGALGEVASGAASLVPGIGTGASLAIDGMLMARDMKKATEDGSISDVAGDVSSAADKSNKTNEELLKENKRLNYQISQLLLKETNILMDGAKVGSMVYKNTYKNSG